MSDPKRLLDEARDGDLAKLLSAGKSEVPDSAQLGALAAKIGVLGGLGGAGAAGAAGGAGTGASAGAGAGAKAVAGATAAKTGLALKIGGAVVVASAASATAIVVTSTREEAAPAPVGIVAAAPPSHHAVSAGSTSLRITETALPPEAASAPPVPRAPGSSLSTKTAAATSAEGPEAEVRLLERAQDALRTRPAEALALADDHARRFPSGMLVQEREVIAIEALVKTGRASDARARAGRFRQRFPGSSHTRRIDTLVAE